MQHAHLDGIGAYVFRHGIDLRAQHLGRHAVDRAHALRVLGRERGDRGHAIATQGAEGFEVCLDAGPATAVGAGDGEHAHVATGRGL